MKMGTKLFDYYCLVKRAGTVQPSLFLPKFPSFFSCTLPKVTYSQKFAFAQRSGAMKAPVGLLSDRTVLRKQDGGARPDKFAFAKRSAAMKAPVGLLSDRTVLRSKMEGPCPDKFTLTHCDFCGSLSQQFNITYLLRVPARLPKEPEQVFNFLIAT